MGRTVVPFEVIPGLAPATSVPAFAGIALGTLVGQSVWAMRGLDPIFQILRTISPLAWLPISLAAFRIAGGILLLFLGLDMARGDFLAMFADKDALADSKDVRGYARRRFQRLVVPFAIPLMIGPGAISAVIIQAGEAAKLGYAGTMGSLAAIAADWGVTLAEVAKVPGMTSSGPRRSLADG